VSLEAAAVKGLKALFRVMDGSASSQKAELALTLHMLEFLAPRFFAEQKLRAPTDAAMGALGKLPVAFGPKLDAEEAMARLDGLYLRAVRGLPLRKFDPAALKGCVERAEQQEGLLWRWLMGALAQRIGVDAELALEERWPFQWQPTLHLYHLTHVVLIQTEYLMKPVPQAISPELDVLAQALDRLTRAGAWDLLAECVMCLNRAGLPAKSAIQALLEAQKPDGSFAETGSSPRVAAHCTAAGILALAGALDLERFAP
jgi:hypothetical protein